MKTKKYSRSDHRPHRHRGNANIPVNPYRAEVAFSWIVIGVIFLIIGVYHTGLLPIEIIRGACIALPGCTTIIMLILRNRRKRIERNQQNNSRRRRR
jgi:hypothetical protein